MKVGRLIVGCEQKDEGLAQGPCSSAHVHAYSSSACMASTEPASCGPASKATSVKSSSSLEEQVSKAGINGAYIHSWGVSLQAESAGDDCRTS